MRDVVSRPRRYVNLSDKKTFWNAGLTPGGGLRILHAYLWNWIGVVPVRKQRIQMEAYAVIETGGKQYRVQKDDVLSVELLDSVEAGQTIELGRVLALNDGSGLKVGSPVLADVKVTAEVVAEFRAPKVVAFKKKRRKGYHRKVGHRQNLLKVKIASIA